MPFQERNDMRCLGFILAIVALSLSVVGLGQDKSTDLSFGQVYGSAGFVSSESEIMIEAPGTILSFTKNKEHLNLVLCDRLGDYIALLQPGYYCLSAYSRVGKQLQLSEQQLKCIDVKAGKDTRLDVMIVGKPEEKSTRTPTN